MEFVTDRTEADVLLANEKGVYSFADLNRVEGNVGLLAEELSALGYALELSVKTDWGLPGDFSGDDWPVESQMERYLTNVRTIRNFFPLEGKGSLPKSMDKLTWQSANLIEMILTHACVQINAVKQAWKYSGEIYAGEE